MIDPFGKELRILIVDDDEVDRMLLQRSLFKSGISVQTVTADGIASATEAVENGRFDCIFLDYRLPGGDGLELLQDFRNKGHHMPIIVITSHGDEKIAVEVMKAGGTDYITKQMISADGVAQILRNALRTHHAEEARRRTARALETSEARLAEAQRIAGIGSWEVDLVADRRYWSDQMYRILGYPEPQAVQPDVELFRHHIHPDQRERAEENFRACVKDGTTIKFDMEVITVDGTRRHAEVHARAIRNAEGRTTKVVGTLQDITHRKQIEGELIQARDMAQRSARAKEEFLANMSHEIRTPLNAILGFAKLLYRTPLNHEQREYLEAIDNSGESLIRIINDILDFSKMEAGRLTYEQRPFELRELITSVTGLLAAKAGEQPIRLTHHVAPELPDRLLGDKGRLRQVLINLVGNALKFTESGEVRVEVSMTSEQPTQVRLQFKVSDTGIGIPQAKLESIFESFTQASSDTTRRYGGTGLGLSICKRIVEQQGGSIHVESALGKGSTFYFDLPFGKVAATEAESVLATTHEGRQDGARGKVGARKLHVLLAEDNRINQRLAAKILEQMDCTYSIAQHGREALDMLGKSHYDLVLMDIQMPEMDGFAATRRIRAHPDPRIRALPVIALTAHALPEEMERCREAGFTDFVSKPFHPETLAAVMRKAMAEMGQPMDTEEDPPASLEDVEILAEGDESFKTDLVNIFLDEVPKALDRLRTAQNTLDGHEMYQAAHAIKPTLILFRVPDGMELITQLEAHARKASPDAETESLLIRLEARCKAALQVISRVHVS